MAVIKIIELVGSSPTSSDDAVKAALTEAQATLATSRPSTSSPSTCAATASTSGAHSCVSRF
jgi:Dodecin